MATTVNVFDVSHIRAKAGQHNGTVWLTVYSFDKKDNETTEINYFMKDLEKAVEIAKAINAHAPEEVVL